MGYPQKGECRNTGRTHFKKGQVGFWKGKTFTDECRQKLSEAHKGKPTWNKGKKGIMSAETLRKMSLMSIGEKSGNWKGGITPLNDGIRKLTEAKEWKYAVSRKYDRTCVNCGKRSSYNHIHHIIAFNFLLEQFLNDHACVPINDRETLIICAKDYAPFWNINNGVIYCKQCHEGRHRKEKTMRWTGIRLRKNNRISRVRNKALLYFGIFT